MNGKGDRNRTLDFVSYRKNFDAVFGAVGDAIDHFKIPTHNPARQTQCCQRALRALLDSGNWHEAYKNETPYPTTPDSNPTATNPTPTNQDGQP